MYRAVGAEPWQKQLDESGCSSMRSTINGTSASWTQAAGCAIGAPSSYPGSAIFPTSCVAAGGVYDAAKKMCLFPPTPPPPPPDPSAPPVYPGTADDVKCKSLAAELNAPSSVFIPGKGCYLTAPSEMPVAAIFPAQCVAHFGEWNSDDRTCYFPAPGANKANVQDLVIAAGAFAIAGWAIWKLVLKRKAA
jgi:hypothetical protein